MEKCTGLIACEECDAVYRETDLNRDEVMYCKRCGAKMGDEKRNRIERILPITIASLILFLIANIFPIVRIEMQGLTSEATLLRAVAVLYSEKREFVAALVFLTTFLFPLSQLMILCYLLLSVSVGKTTTSMRWLIKIMQSIKPWGMMEVFLLGILVALVKLSNMMTVIPDIALWAFSVLTILLVMVVSFNVRFLWKNFY